jgi:two-component system response regulator GlrR
MSENPQGAKVAQTQPRLLLVDDDPDMLALLQRWLDRESVDCVCAGSGSEALTQLDLQRPDLVITDLVMDEMDGLRLLTEIHRVDPVLPVIMLSGEAGVADAMKAAHLGVSAFLTKPPERDALVAAVVRALSQRGAGPATNLPPFAPYIIHRSAAMDALLGKARLVAASESTVLITGNTGTGKELLARAIHDGSPRSDKPFVSVNCSAIPDQLLESELFGHEKGAFTGAVSKHTGLFQAADGGTLFLDEIGDMPLQLQSKLLRVLQDFQVRPVGSTQSLPVNVRLVSATHQDLEAAVAEQRFREDLYYRLSVVPLHLPNLEERREDIIPIVDHLLDGLAERNGWPRKRFTPDASEFMQAAGWPGNIRQLANVVEQCMVLSTSDLIPLDLVRNALREQPAQIPNLDDAKRAFERRYLIDVLRACSGNVAQAAFFNDTATTEIYTLRNEQYDVRPGRGAMNNTTSDQDEAQ